MIYKVRGYKWLLVAGSAIKLIGYGVMIRLRGADNSWAEVFVVQGIQGIGSGLLEIIVIVAAQMMVPHAEMPQVTALVLLASFVSRYLFHSTQAVLTSLDRSVRPLDKRSLAESTLACSRKL